MSFLTRLAARSRPGPSNLPVLRAKGGGIRRQTEPAQDEPETEPVQAARLPGGQLARESMPQRDEAEGETAAPLRRAAGAVMRADAAMPEGDNEPEPETDMAAARSSEPVAREVAEDDGPVAPARRRRIDSLHRAAVEPEQADDAEADTLPVARAAADPSAPDDAKGDEAEIAPIRRQGAGHRISPARGPAPAELSPDNSPMPEDGLDEAPPPDLRARRQAVRRDEAPSPGAAAGGIEARSAAAAGARDAFAIDAQSGIGDPGQPPHPSEWMEADPMPAVSVEQPRHGDPWSGERQSSQSAEPPKVQIDQIDVIIHEPARGAQIDRAAADASRRLRTRYLGRL